MAKSQNTFNKQENEKKKQKKRKDKQQKKDERKLSSGESNFDSMIAYVDENGNLCDTPPDPSKRRKVDASTIEIGVSRRENDNEPTTKIGKIDFFDTSKGFGFIKENDGQNKYFVHVKGLIDEVKEGDTVSFELERGLKGMNAVNVKKH